jgi:hypothetical protein
MKTGAHWETEDAHSVFQENRSGAKCVLEKQHRRTTLCYVDTGEEHTVFLEKERSKHGHGHTVL